MGVFVVQGGLWWSRQPPGTSSVSRFGDGRIGRPGDPAGDVCDRLHPVRSTRHGRHIAECQPASFCSLHAVIGDAGIGDAKPGRADVLVADADKPTELSLQVTRALYSSAKVVVVAASGDEAGMKAAGADAARIGAPLLLLDSTASLPKNVAAEIAPTSTGPPSWPSARTRRLPLGRLDGVKAHHRCNGTAQGQPAGPDAPPGPCSTRTVQRRAGSAVAAVLASTAAAATESEVISVRTRDLRADPDAITALAAREPEQVIAIGAGFGPAETLAGRVAVAKTGVQLPGGGQVLFPGHRLVALYGHPGNLGPGSARRAGPPLPASPGPRRPPSSTNRSAR